MKGYGAAIVLLCLVTIRAFGTIIAYEPFDAAPGGSPPVINGGFGWQSAWSGVAFTTAPGIRFPSLVTSGVRARMTGENRVVGRVLATTGFEALLTPAGKFGLAGTELWLSFCFMVERSSFGYVSSLPAIVLGDGAAIAVSLGLDPLLPNRNPGNGLPTLMVARFQFVGGASPQTRVSLYLNPVPGGTPPATADLEFVTALFEFNNLRMTSNDSGALASYDEIRLGESYGDVVPSNGQLEMMLQPPGQSTFRGSLDFPVRVPVLLAGPGVDSAGSVVNLLSGSPAIAGPANLRWLPVAGRAEGVIEITALQAGVTSIDAEATLSPFTSPTLHFTADIAGASAPGLHLYEGFDYPEPPSDINGRTGGLGFPGTWDTPVWSAPNQLATGSLAVPALECAGKHVESDSVPSGLVFSRRVLPAPLGQPGTVRYISFLAQPRGVLHEGEYGGYFSLEIPGTAGGNVNLGKGGRGANDQWVIESSAGGWQGASGVSLAVDQPALLVGKIEFFEGLDHVSLFVNPQPGGSEPSVPNTQLFRFDLGEPAEIRLVSSGAWAVDELRIGASWESVTPNAPPTAATDTITRPANQPVKIAVATLLGNDSDPANDQLALSAFDATSANGGSITRNGDWLLFTPATEATDTFQYGITDPWGRTATALVTVNVAAADPAQSRNLLSATVDGADRVLGFAGIPGVVYAIQYTTSLTPPTWNTLTTVSAGANGAFVYRDIAPADPTRFYRAVVP